jgi:hypothetical protein
MVSVNYCFGGEGGGEFLLFLHKNIVKILKFFPSLDITNFSNFGYFSQISLISQNGRKPWYQCRC